MGIKSRLFSACRVRLGRGSIRASLRRRTRSSQKLGDLAWLAIKRLAATMVPVAPVAEAPKPKRPVNLDLFPEMGLEEANRAYAEEVRLERIRYAVEQRQAKRRHKKRIKGLQYKLKMEIREKERKLRFARKAPKEVGGNTEHFPMAQIRRMHAFVLRDALDYLRECLEVGSAKASEVWEWMSRPGTEEPFAFETCLRISSDYPEIFDELGEEFLQMDPDEVRKVFGNVIRKRFGAVFPHARLLKEALVEAEYVGNPDAIRWIMSDATTPLSFVDCCDALGFDPEEARQAAVIAAPQVDLAEPVAA